MKQLLLIILAIFFVAAIATAGDDAAPKSKAGDKAVLFSLNGLSNLGAGSFQGGVGGKYYISDGNAIRMGLGFNTSSTTTKDYNPNPGPDQKASSTGFSVTPAFIHTIASSGPIGATVGLQVAFGTQSSTVENPGHVNNNKNHNSTTMFGASVLMGVEWFAWSSVSLAAEYQLGYASTSGTTETTIGGTTTSTDDPTTSGFGMGSVSGANLTVAIFW